MWKYLNLDLYIHLDLYSYSPTYAQKSSSIFLMEQLL